jgi:two-component system, LytTR family, sensor kinase
MVLVISRKLPFLGVEQSVAVDNVNSGRDLSVNSLTLKSWRLWLASFVSWTLYSLFYSLFTSWWVYSAGHWSFPAVKHDAFILILNCWIDALLTPFVLIIAFRFPFERKAWKRRSLQYTVGMFIFTLAHMAVRMFVYPVQNQFTGVVQAPSLNLLWKMFLYGIPDEGISKYAPLVALAQLVHGLAKARTRDLANEELRRILAETELENLKLQLRPHFLFNTLNALSELIHESPADAEKMVVHLSALFRRALHVQKQDLTQLHDEIDFIRHYLEIEKIRFPNRLTWDIDADPQLGSLLIPSLILQPFVENALKHGVSKIVKGGKILIAVKRQDGALRITVQDNGPGFSSAFPHPLETGIGIHNTRQRLENLFPGDHRLTVENAKNGGALVAIEIPIVEEVATVAHSKS